MPKEAQKMIEETSDLPISQRRAIIMDCVIDIALSREEWQTIVSRQDLTQYSSSVTTELLDIEPQSERLGFIRDLQNKLDLYLSSSSISSTERLVRALERSARDQEDPTRQYFVVSKNRVVVRVPDFDESNLGQLDNLGKYLRWCTLILGISNPEVKYLKDPAVGNGIQLTARIERMMDNTIAALTLPPTESGDKAEFKNGFRANIVELLASIKLMRKYTGAIQKGIAPRGQTIQQITLEDLRKSVNTRSGLNEQGVSDFTKIFVKSVFNELTKPNGKFFPGGWIHSLKSTNNVKNNVGIIYKLGYESKVPSAQKILTVLKKGVRIKPAVIDEAKKRFEAELAKKRRWTSEEKLALRERLEPKPTNANSEIYTIDEKTSPDGISHAEFRTGALLLFPLIDPKAQDSPKRQISTDPLSVRDKTVLAFYSKNRDIVDALNLAYATLSSVGKKNSKATVLGYESARGHSVHMSANREWMFRTGEVPERLTDVPEQTRNFLLKLLHRKLTVEQQAEEEDVQPLAQDMEQLPIEAGQQMSG
jgi:hypothetical protein